MNERALVESARAEVERARGTGLAGGGRALVGEGLGGRRGSRGARPGRLNRDLTRARGPVR